MHAFIKLKKRKLSMSAKRKARLREINQTLCKVDILVRKRNNKALWIPTKVDASGCLTMEIL